MYADSNNIAIVHDEAAHSKVVIEARRANSFPSNLDITIFQSRLWA
jgi:hypothetical protein